MGKRKIVVDKRTAAKLHDEAKEANRDVAVDVPAPAGDGLDHMRWPPEARLLAKLIVDPKYLGATQQQLADECGYSLRSVQRYLNDPEFEAYCNAIAEKMIKGEGLLAESVQALRKGLRDGNMKAVELVFKAKGYLKEIRQVTADVTTTDNRQNDATDDEIERLRRELGVGEKRKDDAGEGVVN
jgi:hypothetical protein